MNNNRENWLEIFPNGIWLFVVLAIISSILNKTIDSVASVSISYVFILLYFAYIICITTSKKMRLFTLKNYIQWMTLLGIPLLGSLSILYIVKYIKDDNEILIKLLCDSNYVGIIIVVFFFFSFAIWSFLLVADRYNFSNKKYFAYAVTCIPISKSSNETKFKVCIINNKSHDKASWMFPGGHFDLSKNYFNKIDDSLNNVKNLPGTIISEKVKNEAGIEDLKLLKLEEHFCDMPSNSATSKRIVSPAFSYLFKVSDKSNCYNILEHRVHYDFTYIGEYKEINSGKYDSLEVEFEKNCFEGDYDDCLARISNILTQKINEKLCRSTERLSAKDLFPDSIPEMIYNANCYYKYYKVSEKYKSDLK